MINRKRAAASAVALVATVAALSACSSSGSGKPSASPSGRATSTGVTASGTTTPTGSASPSTSPKQYYVSIGDSYAAGYQPTGKSAGKTTRNGFAYQLVSQARAKGYDLSLVNFGCAGATTASVLKTAGCEARNLGPGASSYSATQAAAAEQFLRAHRADVALITVSLGGNDVTACASSSDPVSCVGSAITTIKTNLTTLVKGLRAAAGPKVRMVGITYPDVLLGDELSQNAKLRSIAGLSVTAFQALINPGLQTAYQAGNAQFVDVTKATGAYGSMSQKTTLAPYGSIPEPVAKICTLTFYCQYGDIHPRTNGYAVIATLIAGLLPTR